MLEVRKQHIYIQCDNLYTLHSVYKINQLFLQHTIQPDIFASAIIDECSVEMTQNRFTT